MSLSSLLAVSSSTGREEPSSRKAFKTEIPGTTKIIIAQRVASVEDADVIVVMEDGKIAACGNHNELMKSSDIYREVYTSQTKRGDEE